MPRSIAVLLALATLSAGARAQYANQAVRANDPNMNQSQPGPRGNVALSTPQVRSSQPISGVWLRSDASSSVQTVSADANGTEIRVNHGRANVQVYHPAPDTQILVDLPGGQTSLLKDGLYTFNADTDTVGVVRGEADSYPAADSNAKPIKVKENHELALSTGPNLKAVGVDQRQIASDVLPGSRALGDGYRGSNYGYGSGPYGDGAYGYPYAPYAAYGYGYPYGYGFGYPFGFGVGLGYYGGFRGGYGYGGGFRGGFRR